MKDMLGNDLKKGDLVAYASPSGSNSRQRLAIVVNPEKKSIFSMYTYHIGDEIQYVFNTMPGHGVSKYKLLLIDKDRYAGIYRALKDGAKKWL